MTLNLIIEAVAKGYYAPTRLLAYWDMDEQKPRLNPDGGDSLAALIVQELYETFCPGASDEQQLENAMDVMQDLASDFAGCLESLHALKVKIQLEKKGTQDDVEPKKP